MKKINNYIIALLFVPVVGCVTHRGAVGYFANHSEDFADACRIQFPVAQESVTTDTIAGPIVYADCGPIVDPLTVTPPADGVVVSVAPYQNYIPGPGDNASGRPSTTGRRLVPVQCPPSTHTTETVVDQSAVIAAQRDANQWRNTAEKNAKDAYLYRRLFTWLGIAAAAYIAARVFKKYAQNIPVVGWILRLIP